MSREIDRRDFSINRSTDARESRLHAVASAVSDRLPGAHRVNITSFLPTTGNPAVVRSQSAAAEKGNYIQRALSHVGSIGGRVGLRGDSTG